LIAEGANMVDSILLKNYAPVTLAPKILWDAKGFDVGGGFRGFRVFRLSSQAYLSEDDGLVGARILKGASGIGVRTLKDASGFGCIRFRMLRVSGPRVSGIFPEGKII
jgi:hypothetical protein